MEDKMIELGKSDPIELLRIIGGGVLKEIAFSPHDYAEEVRLKWEHIIEKVVKQ